jgi:hypothetical protein
MKSLPCVSKITDHIVKYGSLLWTCIILLLIGPIVVIGPISRNLAQLRKTSVLAPHFMAQLAQQMCHVAYFGSLRYKLKWGKLRKVS